MASSPIIQPPYHLNGIVVAAVAASSDLTIEEDHDYDYVFQCKLNVDGTQLACSLSCHYINIYDPKRTDLITKITGHSDTINEIKFSSLQPNLLLSCSSDRTAHLWDTRVASTSGSSSKIFRAPSEVWSADFGCGENLIALGLNDAAQFYDIRNGKKLGEYGESHADAITTVKFHPLQNDHLITASEDGVVCVFDCSISDEDDAVKAIVNAESSIRKIELFGKQMENIAILTGTETMSLWNLQEAERLGDFQNPRQDLCQLQAQVDYLIDCKYDPVTSKLYLIAGNHSGHVYQLEVVKNKEFRPLGVLGGGHKACVRTISWDNSQIITGGEDSRICFWSNQRYEGNLNVKHTIRASAERDVGGMKSARRSTKPY